MPSIHFKSHPTFYPIRSSTYCEISFKMLVQRIKNTPEEIILTQCYVLIDRLGLSKCQVFRCKASDDQVFSWNLSQKFSILRYWDDHIHFWSRTWWIGSNNYVFPRADIQFVNFYMIFEFYIFWFWKIILFVFGSNENNKICFWNILTFSSRSKIWSWFMEVPI